MRHTLTLILMLTAAGCDDGGDALPGGQQQADAAPDDAATDAGSTPDAEPDGGAPDAAQTDAAPPDAAPACALGEANTDGCPQRGVCAGSAAPCLEDGTFGACALPATHEADEATCDGLDNDCDGATDEGFPDLGRPCDGDDDDLCALGQWRCAEDGAGVVCADDEPQVEVCDGVDDDCDDVVDEDAIDAPPANRQMGVCEGALRVCAGEGGWVEPAYVDFAAAYEVVETTCDGLDNDCDGRVDVGLFPPRAALQDGVCEGARQICAGADGWVEPDYAALPGYAPDEITCDGVDEDCDGATDEALTPPPCALTEGVCFVPAAPSTCLGASGWSACDYGPDFEADEADTCDALDNDCDGAADEGAPCPVALQAVRVPAGAFTLGSPEGEMSRDADEAQRRVTLTRPLLARRTEITQQEWVDLLGDNPSLTPGADRPVEQVSWVDAATFANAVSTAEGLAPCYTIEGVDVAWPEGLDCEGWRLPTEAEWEYLARAGTTSHTFIEAEMRPLTDAAWLRENSQGTTQPVGDKAPNAFGLFDVLGNVWEWVWDAYAPYPAGPLVDPLGPAEGAARVARGGGFNSLPRLLRSANRADFEPATRVQDLGLRLVRTAPPAPEDDE